jgi:hypothetical protein
VEKIIFQVVELCFFWKSPDEQSAFPTGLGKRVCESGISFSGHSVFRLAHPANAITIFFKLKSRNKTCIAIFTKYITNDICIFIRSQKVWSRWDLFRQTQMFYIKYISQFTSCTGLIIDENMSAITVVLCYTTDGRLVEKISRLVGGEFPKLFVEINLDSFKLDSLLSDILLGHPPKTCLLITLGGKFLHGALFSVTFKIFIGPAHYKLSTLINKITKSDSIITRIKDLVYIPESCGYVNDSWEDHPNVQLLLQCLQNSVC